MLAKMKKLLNSKRNTKDSKPPTTNTAALKTSEEKPKPSLSARLSSLKSRPPLAGTNESTPGPPPKPPKPPQHHQHHQHHHKEEEEESTPIVMPPAVKKEPPRVKFAPSATTTTSTTTNSLPRTGSVSSTSAGVQRVGSSSNVAGSLRPGSNSSSRQNSMSTSKKQGPIKENDFLRPSSNGGDGVLVSSSNNLLGNNRKSVRGENLQKLSVFEESFLPGDLLTRLGQSAGQLPPAPSVYSAQGAVLFVDVSGFTALAERLGKELVPVKASEKLAFIITRVLQVLAECVLNGGGEVGKFAGDALLCVFEHEDLDVAEQLAKQSAVQILLEMEQLNKKEGVGLQVHGGIGKGSIVHFHFGSVDDDVRWYIVSGEACASATTTVDVAKAGEFCVQTAVAKGLPELGPEKDGRKTLIRGNKTLATTILTKDSQFSASAQIPPPVTTVSVLKDGLPKHCNVYIPVQLRDQLNERDMQRSNMRRRVAICFVEISNLKMTEEELLKHTVSDTKLDLLNNAFVTMTRILHAFQGEVRDMLFDDKGGVFIGLWGAHAEEEDEKFPCNLLAVKAAMAICQEVKGARAGVSVGTCYVGFAGVPRRRMDFVVVGHEVNMAARYMSNAKPGQVLVSSTVFTSTKEMIKYGPEQHVMVGKGKWAKDRSVYTPLEEFSKRASFQASYRNSMKSFDVFVGRQKELNDMEKNLSKLLSSKTTGGVLIVEGPVGSGKTTLLKQAKKMGKGKIKIVSGDGHRGETRDYYPFRHVLESMTGIRPSMDAKECQERVGKLESGGKEKINLNVLAAILPWVENQKTQSVSPKDIADMIFKLVKLAPESSALMVLDDVQFYDDKSLELCLALLNGVDKNKVGLLLCFRTLDKTSMENTLLQEVCKRAKKVKTNALTINVQPLSKDETKEMASKLIGTKVEDLGLAMLYNTSKGDPSFLGFLVQWLDEFKHIARGVVQSSLTCTALPATCEQAILECIEHALTSDEFHVLSLASLAGDTFDAKFVVNCSQDKLKMDKVLQDLYTSVDHDFIRAVFHSGGSEETQKWKFMQDCIYLAVATRSATKIKPPSTLEDEKKQLRARMIS